MNKRFKHTRAIYNHTDAKIIVPFIMNTIAPQSVIDLGCGTGTWLKVFKDSGVSQVVGLDGAYHEEEQIYENLLDTEFFAVNLEDKLAVYDLLHAKGLMASHQSFDLILSLEVAEHLRKESADDFIELVTSLSKSILFSAAIPKQGGDGHINEQWPTYWIEKFEKRGYKVLDVIRPFFWNNEDLKPWYKQNMFLIVECDIFTDVKEKIEKTYSIPSLFDVVHPIVFLNKMNAKMGIRSSFSSLQTAIIRKMISYIK